MLHAECLHHCPASAAVEHDCGRGQTDCVTWLDYWSAVAGFLTMQQKHARCVRAALLLTADVMPKCQASVYLRVPWHSIRDRSKNRGCNKPRDNVKYRRHSKPCRVQSVTLGRRRRITESGVHSESKRRTWTSCRQPMLSET